MIVHPTTYIETSCPFVSSWIRKGCFSETNRTITTRTTKEADVVFHFPDFPDIQVLCYKGIEQISTDWDQLACSSTALLKRAFLKVIEDKPPLGIDFRYMVFYQNQQPVGIAYFQLLLFEADRSLQVGLSSSTSRQLKKWVARQFHNLLLFAGNAMLTGQHAYYFRPDYLAKEIQTQLLQKASWQLATHFRYEGIRIDAIVHKDIPEVHLPAYQSWTQSSYHALRFQPDMQMKLDPEWRSFEDYLNAMSSKYRVRARRAAKKSDELTRRWLTFAEVCRHERTIYALYHQIADQAEFNLVDLHPQYFSQMKESLGEDFEVLAYFAGTKMVGFCTLLHNHDRAEAHFLGYESDYNHSCQIYLNMLYDLIRAGIEKRKTAIGFARTAMEIKSSVGAEPEEIYTLVRSYNPLANCLIPPIVKLLVTETSWEQRHPFR